MTECTSERKNSPWLIVALLLICCVYFAFEYYYVHYTAFVVDEFNFARQIYDYSRAIPYRDFPPYKGTLGNYLFVPAMLLSHDIIAPLFYIKTEIVILNTFLLFICTYWTTRIFDYRAVLLALLAVLANQHFLLLSSELRVDMLAGWLCLLSILAILSHKPRLSGIFMGIAFLISQKVAWYIIAINGAMLASILLSLAGSAQPSRDQQHYSWRTLFTFNLYVAAPIAIYCIFWSLVASPSIVFQTFFYEVFLQATMDWYQRIYLICWANTLVSGPLLFILWPLTLWPLFEKNTDAATREQRVFIIFLASLFLVELINYKQPFPYNFVFTFPAFLLLYSQFLTWLLPKLSRSNLSLSILAIFISLGIAYPLYNTFKTMPLYNGNYQRDIMRTVDELTNDGSYYVAGIPLLYNKDQPIKGMVNLIGPQIEYLSEPTDKLANALLTSLSLSKVSQFDVLKQFSQKPVKYLLFNSRISALPPLLLSYLAENYNDYYGCILIYGPHVLATKNTFALNFSGKYRLFSKTPGSVLIDGKKIPVGQTIYLKKGIHSTHAKFPYHVILSPDKALTHQPVAGDGHLFKAVI